MTKPLSLALIVAAVALGALASYGEETPNVQATKLADGIYKITETAPGGGITNLVASLGEDGLLLVDTGLGFGAAELKTVLENLGGTDPRIIINTHEHVDHTGGNLLLGKNAVIIAHKDVRTRLTTGNNVINEVPEEALPDVGFDEPITVHFNGEDIKVIPLPGSHSDTDAIVWFTKSRVVYMGGLLPGAVFPSVDGASGDFSLFPEVYGKAIEILPADVTLVSGHGRDFTVEDLKAYLGVITTTTDVVKRGLAEGKDVARLQKEKVLGEWDSYGKGFITADTWIRMVANDQQNLPRKKSLVEPLYYTARDQGADAAIAQFRELRQTHGAEYNFDPNGEAVLNILGYYLLGKSRTPEAVKMFQFMAGEYPKSWNAWDSLAEGYMASGDNKLAVKYYKKSIKLNPENQNGKDKLKELGVAVK
jgi:glyoxylase-like metal-dependent hydrolase (beta-lactamase superfamily II)